jgi:nicotinate (nicotinamide) nucleotide adenylyltransferase
VNPFAASTGIFGGTFDPPHMGHKIAVEGILDSLNPKKILVIPSGKPTLKNTVHTSPEHRLAMTQTMFQGFERVKVTNIELLRAQSSQLPSYSFDTLKELKADGEQDLFFIIGADQLLKLPKWHGFPTLLALCNWVVLLREPDGEQVAKEGMNALISSGIIRSAPNPRNNYNPFPNWEIKSEGTRTTQRLTLVTTKAPGISSTEIRKEIAIKGTPPDGSLDATVWNYLKENNLYGTSQERSYGNNQNQASRTN